MIGLVLSQHQDMARFTAGVCIGLWLGLVLRLWVETGGRK